MRKGPSLAACISIHRPVKAPVKCQIASIIDNRSATKHGNSVPSPSLVSNDALVGLFFFCNNNLNANTAHHLALRDCEWRSPDFHKRLSQYSKYSSKVISELGFLMTCDLQLKA